MQSKTIMKVGFPDTGALICPGRGICCGHSAISMETALKKRIGWAVLLVFLQGAAVLAVPSNDNFSNRLTLSPSGATETIGDNTGATLEASEPIPAGFTAATYQATAWWNFSPAAFEGWYQIETTGSTIDTVLAVWTGLSYTEPLTLVHVNDEAAPGSGVSRILFFASPSVSYRISVASRSAARGSVTLRAFSISDPFASVTAAQFSPTTVNVGGAPATVTATLTIVSDFDVDSGELKLFNPAGGVVATAPVSSANRTDPFDSFYVVPITLPANSPAGAYRWSVSLQTEGFTSNPNSSHGWEAASPYPTGALKSINVISDSYSRWLTANSMTGPTSLRAADFDSDGSKNLIEFAFGTDPRNAMQLPFTLSGNSITGGLPVVKIVGSGGQRRLRIEFVRRVNDPTLTYTPQFGDDPTNLSALTPPPTETVLGANSEFEVVAVEDQIFVPARPRRFGRVSVTQ